MANIKFSQFTVETAKADVDFLVGYSGPDNVQISPTNLLADYPAGSGAAGQVTFFSAASTVTGDNDFYWDNVNKRLGVGTASPATLLHVGGFARFDGSLQLSGNDRKLVAINNTNLIFGTNNIEKMRIDSSGNVGINTTSPSAKLEVDGTLIATGISQLGSGGSNVLLTSSSAGNVGIGTSSPSYKLDVYGDAVGGVVRVKNVSNGRDTLRSENAAGTRTLNFGNDGSGHGVFIIRDSSGGVRNYITGSGDSYFNGGNVGIGTSSPQTKLHVSGGQALFASDTAVNPILPFGIEVYRNTGGDSNVLIHQDDGNHESVLHMRCGGNDTKIKTGPNTWALKIDTETVTDAIALMATSGNLGIGTTNPVSKLDVAGNIQATGTRFISCLFDSNHYMRIESNGSGGLLKGADGGVITTLVRSYGDSYFNGGNFGIGTSSPSFKLEVSGGGTKSPFYTSDGGRGFKMDSVSLVGTYSEGSDANGANDIGSNSNKWRDAYFSGQVNVGTKLLMNNNQEIRWKDSGGTERTMLELDSSNNTYLGTSAGGNLYLVNGSSYTTAVTIDSSQNTTFAGDVEIANSSNGIILESPDGTRYRVTVANGGTLSVSAV